MIERLSILSVDDSITNLELVRIAFDEYEHVSITDATNGKQALELLEKDDFDVVLLDISMPEMDGIEVLEKIRANEALKQIPVLMVTADADKEKEALKKGASDFISKPYDIGVLQARTLNYAKLNLFYKHIRDQNKTLEVKVAIRTKELQDALRLSKETEYEISTRLGRASEFRDLETGGHIKRMSHYSELLGRLYGLSDEECELILYASPLHDIGKVGIPDSVLLKPGKFNEDEFNIMKQHSEIGAKMLESTDKFPVLQAGHIIALEHHEKYDGSGYPKGLKGKDIHLYARIVAIADVFDALGAKRCYKDAMPMDKVLQIMKESSGKHFDPELIELFFNNIDKFLNIKDTYLDDEQSIPNIH